MKITICQPFLNHPGIRVTHGILFLGASNREAKKKKKNEKQTKFVAVTHKAV